MRWCTVNFTGRFGPPPGSTNTTAPSFNPHASPVPSGKYASARQHWFGAYGDLFVNHRTRAVKPPDVGLFRGW